MHDLTYAKEIINAVTDKMKTLDHHAVLTVVNAAVSPLSHVKPETLEETFAALVKGTPLEPIILNVKTLQLGMKCDSCQASFSIDKPTFLCPKCHSSSLTITDQKEFEIESMETGKRP
jgi:hydrogenase nickel incorporation protein HypA/HybF